MLGAVERNPMDAHLRLAAAKMLCDAGEYEKCLAQIAEAEEIDRKLIDFAKEFPPPSKTILGAEDKAQIELLRARAGAGSR
jgi:protein involved in temperature-dependent protein secretion